MIASRVATSGAKNLPGRLSSESLSPRQNGLIYKAVGDVRSLSMGGTDVVKSDDECAADFNSAIASSGSNESDFSYPGRGPCRSRKNRLYLD
jgi:hypothetical protein